MSAQTRRTIWFLLVPLLLAAVVGLPALWGVWSFLSAFQGGSGGGSSDPPTPLASFAVPNRPNSLAWSADGSYLAAGTWGSTTEDVGAYEVYVVEVAKVSVVATLEVTSAVEGLAFSPDGKWLAVAGRPSTPGVPCEMVVFDVPAFTARFTAKVGAPENGFLDLAWAADSKSLFAIDGPVNNAAREAKVRRWDVPDFTERPVVRAVQLQGDAALAVSPNGRTLAVSFGEGMVQKSLVQLFELDKEGEQSLRSGDPFWPPRLGFTADGKAVGVFDTKRMLWWDVATGRPMEPGVARFAVQPAGLSEARSRAAVSPSGAWVAWGSERHPGLGHLSWNDDDKKYGGFVQVTESATGKSQTWRVSRGQYPPAVAFSPDGTKLAGTIWQPNGGSILIWAAPK